MFAGLFGKDKDFDIDKHNYIGDPIGFSCVYDEDQTNFHQVRVNGSIPLDPTDLIAQLNNGKNLSIYFDGIGSRVKPNGNSCINVCFYIKFIQVIQIFQFVFQYSSSLVFLNRFFVYFQVLLSISPKVYDQTNGIKRNKIHNWLTICSLFSTEWFIASDSNICYVTYAYEKIPDGPFDTLMTARDMVKSHRLQYAAKVTRDLVLGVREQCLENETPGCLKNMSQVTVLGFR